MPTSTTVPLTMSSWPADTTEEIWDVTVDDLLRRAAREVPDRVALVDGTVDPAQRRSWTYAEFLAQSEQAARALLKRFSPGDRIAIWAPNCAEWLIARQGVSMAGMVLVALNPAYRSEETRFVLRQSGAAGIFLTPSYRGQDLSAVLDGVRADLPDLVQVINLDTFDEFLAEGVAPDGIEPPALPEVRPNDAMQIQYTSGTTGFPKGAVLHHRGLVNEARFVSERAGMTDGAVNVNAMPMYHIGGGAVTSFGVLAFRGTFVVMHAFEPGLMLEALATHRGTHSLLVPTMLQAMLEHPSFGSVDLSAMRTVMSGASAVPASLVQRTKQAFGCDFSILFGQTEMHGVISQTRTSDSAQDQAETVGQPLPHLEVKVIDPLSGEIVPVGERGEICCRGYQVMLGFHEAPEATAATIDEDGWLHMGDLGTMDERGFLAITGRLKDMVIRGGMNLYPAEVEETLSKHDAIAEVSVIGVPDEQWGEQLAAICRLASGAEAPTVDDLRAWCRERLSAHKAPFYWAFVPALPTTPTGKVQKFVLRDEVANARIELLRPTSAQ
jgi:fatty-acyl-CoA synthase